LARYFVENSHIDTGPMARYMSGCQGREHARTTRGGYTPGTKVNANSYNNRAVAAQQLPVMAVTDMYISPRLNGVVYVAELPRRGAGRINGLLWSRVTVEPIADGERRIDAAQVPKRIRRAAYRLFDGDRKRELNRSAPPASRPVHGESLAQMPQLRTGGSPSFFLTAT
jgi:hypothetical protein